MRLVQNLASNELVRNLPKLSFERHYCDTCLGSQGQASNKNKNEIGLKRQFDCQPNTLIVLQENELKNIFKK